MDTASAIEPETTQVNFHIDCKLANNQKLILTGNLASLGAWDPTKGVSMELSLNSPSRYETTISFKTGQRIFYKYAIVDATNPDHVIQKEDFATNRKIKVEGVTMKVNDASFNQQDLGEQDRIEIVHADQKMSFQSFTSSIMRIPSMMESSSDASSPRVPLSQEPPPSLSRRLSSKLDTSVAKNLSQGDVTRLGVSNNLSKIVSRSDNISPAPTDSSPAFNIMPAKPKQTILIVLYRLPIVAERDPLTQSWKFSWDDDALYMTSSGIRDAISSQFNIVWIGILNTQDDISLEEQFFVSKKLHAEFNCVPVFFPKKTLQSFYQGFCKSVLWPNFHTANDFTNADGSTVRFDRSLWNVYCTVNRKFSDTVVENYVEGTLIWIHDYHLMVLPAQLRRKLSGAKIGFYLHVPWPSSEIYRVLPYRDEILRGLLSSTLLGFNLFDHARHFLSSCTRLLNLEHHTSQGMIDLDYAGRHVMVRVSHIGVNPERFIAHRDSTNRVIGAVNTDGLSMELGLVYKSKLPYEKKLFVIAGIDDLDFIKGMALKLKGFEKFLEKYGEFRGKVQMIQVALPKVARSSDEVQKEILGLVDSINQKFGSDNYTPVKYIVKNISFNERIALYRSADVLLLTPMRDGLNLVPYEYILSVPPGKGQLILGEFTGCSRALSSANRVNPFNFIQVADAINDCLHTSVESINQRNAIDRDYCIMHSASRWTKSFLKDLKKVHEPVQKMTKLGLGFGVGLRMLEFEGFERLNSSIVLKSFNLTGKRLFLLDYDGTLVKGTCSTWVSKKDYSVPNESVLNYVKNLSNDPKNIVYIMSGRMRDAMESTFAQYPNIGLVAEHGFYYRVPGADNWKMFMEKYDSSWKEIAREIFLGYTERTDGSYLQEKSVGFVWHYTDADAEFGRWQVQELHDHLESVLGPFSVQVISGQGWLQARLEAFNKGAMVKRILQELGESSRPDFVLCAGDDRSDEDMFTCLKEEFRQGPHIYACTVGVKPSNARYYLSNVDEVIDLLGILSMNEHVTVQRTHIRNQTMLDLKSYGMTRALDKLRDENLTMGGMKESLLSRRTDPGSGSLSKFGGGDLSQYIDQEN